jgi:hypothetical protein
MLRLLATRGRTDLVTKKLSDDIEKDDPWEDKAEVPVRPFEVVKDREFLTVTLKAGTGFDSPWLVFHANSVDEAVDTLQHEKLDELMDLTARKGKELAKAFGGSQGFSKPAAASSGGGWSKPAQQAAAGSVEWDAEEEEYTCAHGGAVQRKGESAKGPWTGYFCPQPKGSPDQCSPKFLNKKR